jgi:flagellar hook-associated protein 1
MTDLLGLGAAGVRAYQAALVVTGDNVANADSESYVRRTIRLETRPGAAGTPTSRDPAAGAGVLAGPVGRASDGLKLATARAAAGDHARFAARGDWLERLQTLVTSSDLDGRLAGAFDAGTDLAAAPTSLAARRIFLDRLDQAASSFAGLGEKLAGLSGDIDSALETGAGELNDATATLARVNEELRRTTSGSSAANGLLDSRDRLLADIAAQVKISVDEGPRGTVSVRLGSGAGAPLLVPAFGSAVPVAARQGPSGAELLFDPTHRAEAVRLPASGRLAGLLEAAGRVAAARAEIDALADRFAADLNSWHTGGIDALGDPGGALFATETLEIAGGLANAGTAGIDFSLADGATLAPDGYRLLRDAGGWTLSRLNGSASVAGPGPLVLDGITVRPGSGAAIGDSWELARITGARAVALRPVAPERLALADPFLVDADPRNAGGAGLAVTADAAAAAFAPAPPYRLLVTAAGTAEISDIATGSLLASAPLDGTPIAGAGFAIAVIGTPRAGDTFRILVTGAGSSDNGNIRALSDIRRNAGTGATLEAGLDASIARIATGISETRRLIDTALAVKEDTARAADAISGVDLDREAAELTRLQAAYRANAQVIAAAKALFDTLLQVAQ